MIEIDKVSKWYGDFQVLAECSTHVRKGEVVVVCGPSGSGKSTLIKCVNALEPFQHGEIRVNGVSVGDPATDLPFGDTVKNLQSAVHGETHEYTDMYPGMAKAARQEGFAEIADWFETLAKAEKSHAGRFSKLLDSVR